MFKNHIYNIAKGTDVPNIGSIQRTGKSRIFPHSQKKIKTYCVLNATRCVTTKCSRHFILNLQILHLSVAIIAQKLLIFSLFCEFYE